jgi:alginate O-acetyltransferase complex protein AlgI
MLTLDSLAGGYRMVFSSFVFLFAFLPAVLTTYFLAPNRFRNPVLLIFSLVFYAWGEPLWILILLINVGLGWMGGIGIAHFRGRPAAKTLLALAVSSQLVLLVYFKYIGLLITSFAALLQLTISFREPGLPIGISFFTFHLISYLVDVYRGDGPALRSYTRLLLYIAMFPQLVAGPIIRYADVQDQLKERRILPADFSYGIGRFAVGLGKKVILANALGELSPLFLDGDLSRASVLGAWLGITLFALHIYFDFSGYSDMAIGLGRMFGFTFRENFDYPYLSRSATEFWRRWNISVGRFFRDYVYIPLGGNKKRIWFNLFVVWSLTGLWHGANWNYVVWGLYFGLLIALERLGLGKALTALPSMISHVYLIIAVLVGWVFFYFTSMSRGLSFLRLMCGYGDHPLTDAELFIVATNHLWLFVIALLAATPYPARFHRLLAERMRPSGVRAVYAHAVLPVMTLALMLLSAVLLVGKTYTPFFYFRF